MMPCEVDLEVRREPCIATLCKPQQECDRLVLELSVLSTGQMNTFAALICRRRR